MVEDTLVQDRIARYALGLFFMCVRTRGGRSWFSLCLHMRSARWDWLQSRCESSTTTRRRFVEVWVLSGRLGGVVGVVRNDKEFWEGGASDRAGGL